MKRVFVNGTDFRGNGYISGDLNGLYGVTQANGISKPYFYMGKTTREGKNFKLYRTIENLEEGDEVYMDGSIYAVVSYEKFAEFFGISTMKKLADRTGIELEMNVNCCNRSKDSDYGITHFETLARTHQIVAVYGGNEDCLSGLSGSDTYSRGTSVVDEVFHDKALVKKGTYDGQYAVCKYNTSKKLFLVLNLGSMKAEYRSAKFIELNADSIMNVGIDGNTFNTLNGSVVLSVADMAFQDEHYSTVEKQLKRYNARATLASKDNTKVFDITPDGILRAVNIPDEEEVNIEIPEVEALTSIGKKAITISRDYRERCFNIFIPENIKSIRDDSFVFPRGGRRTYFTGFYGIKVKIIYDGYSKDVQDKLLEIFKNTVCLMKMNESSQFVIQFNHIVSLDNIQFINSYDDDGSLQFGLQFGPNAMDSYKPDFIDVCRFASNAKCFNRVGISTVVKGYSGNYSNAETVYKVATEFVSQYQGTELLHRNVTMAKVYEFYARFIEVCKLYQLSEVEFIQNLINICDAAQYAEDIENSINIGRGIKQILKEYFNTGSGFNGLDGYDSMTLEGYQRSGARIDNEISRYSFDFITDIDLSKKAEEFKKLGIPMTVGASTYYQDTMNSRLISVRNGLETSNVLRIKLSVTQASAIGSGICDATKECNKDSNVIRQSFLDNVVVESPTVAQLLLFLGGRVEDIKLVGQETGRATKLKLLNSCSI